MTEIHDLQPTTSNRRQFLLAGSVAVAGAMLLGSDLTAGPSGLELLAASGGPRVPVAYIEGSAGARSLIGALRAGGRAVPALGMRPTSSLVGKPAAISVRGFASPVHGQRQSPFTGVFVDALIQSPAHHAETVPFYAFTFRRDPAVSLSGASKLRLAAGRHERVGMRLTANGATAGAATTVVFGSTRSGNMATMQPGVYLLGLQQGMWSRPTALPAVGSKAWAALPSVVVVVEASAAS